jgi:hypothetical protein
VTINHVDDVSSGVIGGSAALRGLMAGGALPTAFGGINDLQCSASGANGNRPPAQDDCEKLRLFHTKSRK